MEAINYYKAEQSPASIWINKEYLVQLNLTGDCPRSCEFCYMGPYQKKHLTLKDIRLLWENLRRYSDEIEYRVNLTGGDIFWNPEWKEIAGFIAKEGSITAVDPLINRFWRKEHLGILEILKKKINFVQLNPEVVKDADIEAVDKIGRKVVLKIALYKGDTKREIEKIRELSQRFGNIIVSVDLIIPQKCAPGMKEDYLIFDNQELLREVDRLKRIFGKKLWLLSTTVKREYLKEIYYCPVPFGGVYVMPDRRIVPCSRYSHLETGFTIKNFDLKAYVTKYNRLCSNFCLYENKLFDEFWKKEENPINFAGENK